MNIFQCGNRKNQYSLGAREKGTKFAQVNTDKSKQRGQLKCKLILLSASVAQSRISRTNAGAERGAKRGAKRG